jgi:hypothetical protein
MSLSRSQRIMIAVGAAAGACAIAVPAAVGLSGTPTFSQRIPVRVPTSAQVITYDDHGRTVAAHDAGDDSPRSGTPSTSAEPSRSAHSRHEPEPGDDRGSTVEPGDDRGSAVEPGDDRGGRTTDVNSAPSPLAPTGSGDDHGRHDATPTAGRGATTADTARHGSGSDGTGEGSGHGGGHGSDG